MEKKINIAEILKKCPRGMELDCTMYDNCTYEGIEDNGYIDILINTPSGRIRLTKEGCYIRSDDNAKCVIFPKGKTTWEGFVPPCKFKDGDILADANGNIAIYKGMILYNKKLAYYYYCGYRRVDNAFIVKNDKDSYFGHIEDYHYATEEEKAKLFQAIKDNGYNWNEEKKTLEKLPRFKVGDRIKSVISLRYYTVVDIKNGLYCIKSDTEKYPYQISFRNEINYELVPNKFDISTLKPFESRVLVRDKNSEEWRGQFFSHYYNNSDRPYICIGTVGLCEYKQCIPYEGNEHLLSTKDDCADFYKIW